MWYAQRPTRCVTQICADIGVALWTVLWVFLARLVHSAVTATAAPAHQLQQAGASLTGTVQTATDSLQDVPLVGDRLAGAFSGLGSTGATMSSAGAALQQSIERLALILGWTTALVPILLVLVPWLLLRVRFARRAGAAARFLDSAADLDLFALRALANQPMHRLAAISPDPAGAWRQGRADVVARLAEMELRTCGLRGPAPQRTPAGPDRVRSPGTPPAR